jgi:DNA replicative helicase MCM subunit Mcm2 (Cdc46/Mcm family)
MLQDEAQPLNERLLKLCRDDPRFVGILTCIRDFYVKVDQDAAMCFKMEVAKGAAYADMTKLLDMGIITWDKTKLAFALAYSPVVFCATLHDVENILFNDQQQANQHTADMDEATTASYMEMMTNGQDMLELWAPQINPKIEGLVDVKRALLICLASHNDEYGDRGRCHTLMHGDPGSAKSALAYWIYKYLDADFCSQRTSQVGLTGDGRGEEVIPGALPRAHGRTLCIDELDKFANKDRQGVLESMEDGVVHIDVGKHSVALPAEDRIIGCANRIDDFSPELKDRFDFKFEMKKPTGDQEKTVVSSIVKSWFKGKAGYDGAELKAYLAWIKPFAPVIGDDVRGRVEILMHMLIDFDTSTNGSIRKRESVLRVAYTIAKLNHRDMVIGDVLRAIKILHPTLSETTLKAMSVLMERYDTIRPPKTE